MVRCVACRHRIVLVNVDKMRGVVGLTRGWVHRSRWRDFTHAPIPPEMVRDGYTVRRRGELR